MSDAAKEVLKTIGYEQLLEKQLAMESDLEY